MSRIAGIARHSRPRGAMETLAEVGVTLDGGLDGDFRGRRRPRGTGKRQISLIEAGDWATAIAEAGADLPWWSRRANLLVEGFDLPQTAGTRLRIGSEVLLEITVECDPCSRMDELAPGLMQALLPDWRGGALTRVLAGGTIAVGDSIRIEP